MTPDATSAFNAELASAKLAALRLIQDLIRALDDPDPPIPARYRELRLLAVTILRTQPIKPAKSTPAPPPTHAPDPAPAPNPPSDRPHNAEPAHASTSILAPAPVARMKTPFRPQQEWARTAIRSLVASGHLPPIFERLAQPPPEAPADAPLTAASAMSR